MAERGDATPHDIDTAMELGAGYRESFRRGASEMVTDFSCL